MKADQQAKLFEDEKKESSNSKGEPIGLPISRKAMKDWSWKSLDEKYMILTQVGEGTFR
jgi:hypothetical protein